MKEMSKPRIKYEQKSDLNKNHETFLFLVIRRLLAGFSTEPA